MPSTFPSQIGALEATFCRFQILVSVAATSALQGRTQERNLGGLNSSGIGVADRLGASANADVAHVMNHGAGGAGVRQNA